MAVSDVMDVVAVEIHESTTLEVLDPEALDPADGRQAGSGNRLPREHPRVALYQVPRVRVEVCRGPSRTPWGQVRISFGLRGYVSRHGLALFVKERTDRDGWRDRTGRSSLAVLGRAEAPRRDRGADFGERAVSAGVVDGLVVRREHADLPEQLLVLQ